MEIGHGSPSASALPKLRSLFGSCLRGLAVALAFAAAARAQPLDVRLRMVWGGPEASQWRGSVSVSSGQWSQPDMLGSVAKGVPSVILDGPVLSVHQHQPAWHDGLDVQLECDPQATLRVRMAPVDRPADVRQWQIPVSELIDGRWSETLDDRQTQMAIGRAPGDALRIHLHRTSLVFSPGERWTFDIQPHLVNSDGQPLHCRLKLMAGKSDRTVWSAQKQLPVDADGHLASWTGIHLPLPPEEGVYELHVTVARRRLVSPFVPSRPLAERRVQLVVVRGERQQETAQGEPASHLVLELDPASPSWWERLPRWPTLPLARWLPGARSNTAVGQQASVRTLGDRQWMELPAEGWQAYPLPIEQPGIPHEITVEFPADRQQMLSVAIVQSNPEGGFTPTGAGSGFVVSGAQQATVSATGEHRLIIWPRSSEPVLLLANRSQTRPALYRTIRVRAFPEGLPRPQRPPGGRQVLAYLDSAVLSERPAADGQAPPIDDWHTFYDRCRQWVAYLGYAGYDGMALLAAGDGSSLYPSQVWHPTAQFDRGMWSQQGHDPIRKDVLELLLRLCDREGMTLVPLVRMNMPLPALEHQLRSDPGGAQGILLINRYGQSWRERYEASLGTGALYNPLDPRVQQAMGDVIRELAGRYRHHASFGGIVLDLDAGGYAQLPDRDWGLDPVTVQRFLSQFPAAADAAGSAPVADQQAVAASSLPASPDVLQGDLLPTWLQWRSEQLAGLYRQIHQILVQQRFDNRLYLGLGGLLDAEPVRRALQPMLAPIQGLDRSVLLDMGLDFRSIADLDNLVILRPRRYAPAWGVAENGINLELNRHRGIDDRLSSKDLGRLVAGELLLHPLDPVSVAGAGAAPRDSRAHLPLTLDSTFSPAGVAYNARLAESLGRRDVQVIFDGGPMLPMGQHHRAEAWLDTFRRLPPDAFQTIENQDRQSSLVVARWGSAADRTYVYLVNQAPWPVDARVDLGVPFGTALTPIRPRPVSPLEFGRGGAVWNVTLDPYELVAVQLDTPDAQLRGIQTFVAPQVVGYLKERLETISNRITSLENHGFRQPYQGLENPSFEEPAEGVPVPGWTVSSPGVSVVTGPDGQVPDGRHYLRLASAEDAWAESSLIPQPASGQLTVVARIRIPNPHERLHLIMGVDGRHLGEQFRRIDEVPAPAEGQWQEVVFPVKPLPARDLHDLRITFHLIGRGEAWIDDLRLYDVYLSAQERKHLITRITGPASYLLQEERWDECAQVLDGYWPRLLIEQVEPYERQLADLPARRSSSASRKESGWWQRARGLLSPWKRN